MHILIVYKLDINNHKTVSNEKDMNELAMVLKVWWTWIKTFKMNSLLYSLFHIRMTKISYDQLENFKRIEKKIGKSLVNPITAFDHNYMK